MPGLILVMIGGAAGAGLRFEVGRASLRAFGPGFPWGTLAVNLLGGLLIGLLAGAIGTESAAERPVWLLLAVGALGGFTTFSAFSLELFAMLGRGEGGTALAYAGGSVLGAILLLYLGHGLARALA